MHVGPPSSVRCSCSLFAVICHSGTFSGKSIALLGPRLRPSLPATRRARSSQGDPASWHQKSLASTTPPAPTNSVCQSWRAGDPLVVVIPTPKAAGLPVGWGVYQGRRTPRGQVAKRQASPPKQTIFSIKRFMGRRWTRSPGILAGALQVDSGPNGLAVVEIAGKKYTPPRFRGVLQKMKQTAEDYLGIRSRRRYHRPAYFNDAQRQATKDDRKVAGPKYAHHQRATSCGACVRSREEEGRKSRRVRSRGGTYDSRFSNWRRCVEVTSPTVILTSVATIFDQRLIDWLLRNSRRTRASISPRMTMAIQRLKEAAEKARWNCRAPRRPTSTAFITADQSGPKHLNLPLTRAKFEHLVDD